MSINSKARRDAKKKASKGRSSQQHTDHFTPSPKLESSEGKMTQIMAIMHYKNGQEDVIHGQIVIPTKPYADKEALLNAICTKPWKGRFDQVFGQIGHYFAHTASWKMSQLIPTEAFVVNFYDYGNVYACREVMGMTNSACKQYANDWAAKHSGSHDINRGAA